MMNTIASCDCLVVNTIASRDGLTPGHPSKLSLLVGTVIAPTPILVINSKRVGHSHLFSSTKSSVGRDIIYFDNSGVVKISYLSSYRRFCTVFLDAVICYFHPPC